MTQAWLIIAHNEFEILQRLVSALDDDRCDFFIHIDKKVKHLPIIATQKSRVFMLKDRLDVRWGDYSQIACELLLLNTAYREQHYSRYHIISGTHIPLQSNDTLYSFFDSYRNCELMHFWEKDERDIGNKFQRYNFFVRGFTHRSATVRILAQSGWSFAHFVQKRMVIKRFPNENFYKTDNWLSLTDAAVRYLIDKATIIRKKYRFSYCGDEYFVATELMKQPDVFTIVDTSRLLEVEFIQFNPKVYTMADYASLAQSDCLFARKFSSDHMDVVNLILENRR